MERDDAWERVFARLPVAETIARDGIFRVSADELKLHGGREPRLMAKIDTLAERPAVLAEHGLALFPVRNGHYALFPDPDRKSFFRFAGEEDPPVRVFRSAADLNLYDTYPRGQESSESQALDFAFLSSLLPAFCGDPDMRLTVRGRLFSGDFAFRTPVGGLEVGVSRVQIEVDSGYEGVEGIFLVEAKRGRREDFHIRQLWYPFLHWSALSRKRVVPVFFTYSNGQYFLTEFAFGRDFGDLKAVRNRAYCLEEPRADLDFAALLAATAAGTEPEGSFPQANDLDKVVDLVRIAGNGGVTKAGVAEAFGFDERQGDYYANAACYLGFLRRDEALFEVTGSGTAFNALRSRAERTKALVARMLEVPSLREAIGLLAERGFRAEKIAQGELAGLVRKHTGLGASTPERRASTVRAWLGWIMRNVKTRVNPA
ncbi:MAG TPA: hypothetical protein VJ385_16525 [Fibrobacteria bacterium]|nr:hypothetical protein [Fibrobacteria bacterium]